MVQETNQSTSINVNLPAHFVSLLLPSYASFFFLPSFSDFFLSLLMTGIWDLIDQLMFHLLFIYYTYICIWYIYKYIYLLLCSLLARHFLLFLSFGNFISFNCFIHTYACILYVCVYVHKRMVK